MELKDVIHYYLGQECIVPLNHGTIMSIITGFNGLHNETGSGVYIKDSVNLFPYEDIKPLLRPLSDMKDEEIIWMFVLRAEYNGQTVDKQCSRTSLERTFMQIEFKDLSSDYQDIRTMYPNQFKFLLSKGFDLFKLIPNCLALDKTKL